MIVNTRKLYKELVAAGIPIDGVAATEPPRIDFKSEATDAQKKQAEAILQAHDPVDPEADFRVVLAQQGVTIEDMLEALWKSIVEKDSSKVDAIQKLRDAAKIASEQV